MEGYTPNIVMRSSQIHTTLQFVKTCKYSCFLYSSMIDKFVSFGITGIPLSSPIHIKIGMIWKKGKYISGDMQKFLTFTRMYYREHPLTQRLSPPRSWFPFPQSTTIKNRIYKKIQTHSNYCRSVSFLFESSGKFPDHVWFLRKVSYIRAPGCNNHIFWIYP